MLLHPIDFRRHIPRNIGHKAFNVEIIAARDPIQRGFFCAIPIRFNARFSPDRNTRIVIAEGQHAAFLNAGELLQPGEITVSANQDEVTAEIAAPEGGDVWHWPVTHAGYRIFGHWLIDIIPRVLLCQQVTGKKVICLLKHDTPDYVARLLDIMGIAHRPMARLDGSTIVLLATVRRHDWLAGRAFALLRDATLKITSGLPAPSGPESYDRIYISRRQWSNNSRSLTNQSDVEAFFVRHGFTMLFPETLPLLEQFAIFSNARIVAGEAGSALHNSIWSGKNCRFLNLQSARQSHFIQSSLCSHFGQTIVNVFGENETHEWTSPFSIDLGLLESQISQIVDVNSDFWRPETQ